jgi:hypothetical protein
MSTAKHKSRPAPSKGRGNRQAPVRDGRLVLTDFTQDQCSRLAELGAEPEEIEELRRCLPFLRWSIEPPPPVTPVRERLKDLEKALHKVGSLIPSKQTLVSAEAEARLLEESADPDVLENIRRVIEAVIAASKAAREKLPKQRRYHTAWPAVRVIDDALLRGFIRHHQASGLGLVRHGDGLEPHSPMPPRTLLPSRSGNFAKIVEVCWQTLGSDRGWDGAIRTFLALGSRRAESSWAKAGWGQYPGKRGPGRRRK